MRLRRAGCVHCSLLVLASCCALISIGSLDLLPGMPPVPDPKNVNAAAAASMLAPAVAADKPLVYVPHNKSGDVWVIDPATGAPSWSAACHPPGSNRTGRPQRHR